MQLLIPFTEASDMIKTKSGQTINLSTVDEKTVKVEYRIQKRIPILGDISKEFSLNLTYKGLVNEVLKLSYSADAVGIDLIIKGLLAIVSSLVEQKVVEIGENNLMLVHLDKIENVHKALQQIDVEDIRFQEGMAVADFHIK